MQRIAILYITDTFIELAGSERNLYEIVTRLDRRIYEPVVMCFNGGPMVHALREKGVEVIETGLKQVYSPTALAEAWKLYRFLRRRNIRIVVTYHESSDIFGGIVAWLARVPVVISSRRDMGYRLKGRHVLAYRVINRIADRIITVSDAVSRAIAEREKVLWHKLVRIHNGVDAEKFGQKFDREALLRQLMVEPGRPVVGIMAALRRIKGHDYFLQAAARIVRQYPRVVFLIVGWVVEEDYFLELQALVKELQLEENVRFTGGRRDAAALLSVFDIAVFSSINEGFSNAVIEAMAAGKPVVATRSGGTPEAITHGETGLLVAPENANELAGAIGWLLEHRKQAQEMGQRARERVIQHFDLDSMVRSNEELYAALLGNSSMQATARPLTRIPARSAKHLACALLYYSGGIRLLQRLVTKKGGVTILAYHRVTDDPYVLPGMSIRVANFEKQIRHIARYATILPLEQAIDMIDRRSEIPENAIVVTFDDGYRDNYLNAFPILSNYGVPATIFLSVEAIDEQSMLWFDVILEALRYTRKERIDLRDHELGSFGLRSVQDRIRAAESIVSFAKKYSRAERDAFVERVIEQLGVSRDDMQARQVMMSWDDVRAMQEGGVSFGNHGMSHAVLTHLTRKELKYEIGMAKGVIRKRTGIDTKAFAYPNGNAYDFNQDIEAMLRRYDYSTACTLVKGCNDCTANRLTLRRLCVTEGMESNAFGQFSRSLFAVMLSGVFNR